MSIVKVTSHIGRDLLQAANAFKTADIAIWEYIVNSLQYVSQGTIPTVTVEIEHQNKRILISDNGCGMDLNGLNNFFTMHGENKDRKQGKTGRGKYGTGKSAAFGIGKVLQVTTVRSGLKNTAVLKRNKIDQSDGGTIPVDMIETNLHVNESNGTQIIIDDIFIKKIDTQRIIKKVEKHLKSYRQSNPRILIGDHICKYREPLFDNEMLFNPEGKLKSYLGDIELIIKISSVPLGPDVRGIIVSCGEGNLVALEDAGVCSKDMGEYIFGEINVPNLESEKYDMDAYDISRDLKLRPEHPVVIALNMFLGTKLEEVRKDLVKAKKQASKETTNIRLQSQADKIAQLLNSDYKDINDKILNIRTSTKQLGAYGQHLPDHYADDEGEEDGWISGIDERGNLKSSSPNDASANPDNKLAPDLPGSGELNDAGTASLDKSKSKDSGKKRRPRGGFDVEYKNMGIDADRIIFQSEKGVFILNLDHPILNSAYNNLGLDDIGFTRLSHEIVFTEYALALANLAARDDPDLPADEAIYDARETINRISAKSAVLYEI
jgi:hypothetical protein